MDTRNILDGNVGSIILSDDDCWVAVLTGTTPEAFVSSEWDHSIREGSDWYDLESSERLIADLPRELFV